MEIPILFENEDVVVINKPAGLIVHPDGKSDKETLVDWVIANRPQIRGVGERLLIEGMTIDRPGIVHRLDEETSGALIIAKTKDAFAHLKEQFQMHQVQKEYHSFVWGHFKESSGIVDAPIGRSPSDFRRRLAGRGTRGETRAAVTAWEAAHQFEDEAGESFSLMHLFPKTGRTHQLRVHLKYLQRPIVSDKLYAPEKPPALGFSRLALHARTIGFTTTSGERITVTAPYPPDFEAALARYAKP